MATIPYVLVDTPHNSGALAIVKWEAMGQGDVGEPFICARKADRTVAVNGTFGAGGAITVQGSLEPTPVWHTLNDTHQNALVITVEKPEAVNEASYLIRPIVTNGDGTTDLDVVLYMVGGH